MSLRVPSAKGVCFWWGDTRLPCLGDVLCLTHVVCSGAALRQASAVGARDDVAIGCVLHCVARRVERANCVELRFRHLARRGTRPKVIDSAVTAWRCPSWPLECHEYNRVAIAAAGRSSCATPSGAAAARCRTTAGARRPARCSATIGGRSSDAVSIGAFLARHAPVANVASAAACVNGIADVACPALRTASGAGRLALLEKCRRVARQQKHDERDAFGHFSIVATSAHGATDRLSPGASAPGGAL